MVQKEDFVTLMSKKGYTKTDCREIYDDFIATLEEALVAGETVIFRGFGSFEVRERAGRRAKSFEGEDITIPPYKSVKFSAGKRLSREIKEGLIRE